MNKKAEGVDSNCREHVLNRFHYMRLAEDYAGLYAQQIREYTM